MTQKYFPIIFALAGGITLFGACKDSYLEADLKGTDLETNFYKDEAQAKQGLVAIYDVVGWQGNGYVTREGMANAASDDQLAGGGGPSDINDLQVVTKWTLTPEIGPHNELWRKGYSGIFRANKLLEKLPDVPMSETNKARFAAEAKFLRGYFYFDLVRMFENIPLILRPLTTSEMREVPQADPAEVWKQIEDDIKAAIAEPTLPDRITDVPDKGRVTKGTAHAMLGKVYLYQKKWAAAAAEFALVNGPTPGQPSPTYGYQLVANFADLFKSQVQYKYNSESIFEIGYNSTSQGGWGCVSCTEGNVLNIMVGPRGYAPSAGAPDYVSGWSFLVFTKEFYNFIHFDPRFKATVADLDSLEKNNLAKYEKGHDNTGYFLEKYAGRISNATTTGGTRELNFPQNKYDIRLADTYLMEAEALVMGGQSGGAGSRAYALMNAVRDRVGLGPRDATIDNIFEERRLEFAGEGIRFFDLIRTGRATAALAGRGFDPNKHYVFPIPFRDLQSTKMEQNKEWGGTK
ncbi:RagB/SusD family nutrient uptake outer membrane protein [Chitinophaga sp. GCM10012297]|uniref:RagB/SusD family nutrient uptake outer membrane protein n=1 Tax=Chitinophaga chungangae TaxID=2821488 RepID=A0ABS3YD19_9BACT|nr:RagB/SusD family nutrient uptake outer membrane protein [Chitinophaga chungangae]MBO9152004.1 RagB/SusD family nutrient uptake outer membrane protein [Chitinophaga chungangae]